MGTSSCISRKAMFACVALSAIGSNATSADDLTIESWRSDHADIWTTEIIPAFHKRHPDINVVYAPTLAADYNSSLNAKLADGTAGDLITCRPFDESLALFNEGRLLAVNDVAGIEHFSDVAKSAWQTDDGATTFCMPIASVMHGFLYNKDAFSALDLEPPNTVEDFFTVLETIKADGTYTPLGIGTADQWEAATMGFQNIGPNYWGGEEGRKALIFGKQKFTDEAYVAVWKQLAKWGLFMADGYRAQKYPDSQNLFALGRAVIYPVGSWDLSFFNDEADFEFDAFPPPRPAGQESCYISDHTEIGLGINAASDNVEDAKVFLSWIGSAEFAALYSNALPGLFSLSSHEFEPRDRVARTFMSWRDGCKSTIRNSYQILSRGTPNLELELWRVSAEVINGNVSPEEAASIVQSGLESWYTP